MGARQIVAIVDDEADLRDSVSQWLGLSGFEPQCYDSAEAALKVLDASFPGVVVSDIRMPGLDGMGFLRRLQGIDPGLPVILITGHGDVAMAVEAMRIGAYDFIEKPFEPDRLADLVRRAAEARRLTLDNRALRRELADESVLLRRIMGSSPAIERLRESILDIAHADGHVLILGETGTGKSLIAHALHASGPRAGKPFVTVNCAALPEDRAELALFGGDDWPEKPYLDQADGGTLLLEDVEALPPAAQARLLERLSAADNAVSDAHVPNLRVISVSGSLEPGETAQDLLRKDLFYRLAALQITIPPLRDRGEDILTLFTHFCAQFAEEYGCPLPEIAAGDAANLVQAPWPGNIRQLINLAERAVLQARNGAEGVSSLLQAEGLHDPDAPRVDGEKPLKEHVEAFEKMLIDHALRRNRGSVSAVMAELALPRRTLNEKMAKYGLSRADYL